MPGPCQNAGRRPCRPGDRFREILNITTLAEKLPLPRLTSARRARPRPHPRGGASRAAGAAGDASARSNPSARSRPARDRGLVDRRCAPICRNRQERCRSRPARPVAWTRSGMTQRRASRRAPAATRPPSIEPRSRGAPRCPPAALGVSPPWTSRRATPRSPWPARNSEPARRLPSDEVRFSAGPARESSARSRAERASTSETLRARPPSNGGASRLEALRVDASDSRAARGEEKERRARRGVRAWGDGFAGELARFRAEDLAHVGGGTAFTACTTSRGTTLELRRRDERPRADVTTHAFKTRHVLRGERRDVDVRRGRTYAS